MFCFAFFFFKYTAPTEIYPYCHPLSLHDPLPIYLVTGFGGLPLSDAAHMRNPPGKAGENRPGTLDIRRITASHNGKRPSSRPRRTTGHRCIDPRSEEHTSELQSLMRISYAVFCLKKKT